MTLSISNSNKSPARPHPMLSWLLWLGLMAGLVICANYLVGLVFWKPTPQNLEASRLDSSTRIAFLGTSRTQTNIDPLLFSTKTANISDAGITYSVMEQLFAAFLKKAPGLKLVVIECTAESFAYTYDVMPQRFANSLASFGIETKINLTDWAESPGDYLRQKLPNLFSYRLTPRQIVADLPLMNKPSLIKSGQVEILKQFDSAQALQSFQSNVELIEKVRQNRGMEKNRAAFRRILELAKQRGIKIAFLRHPVHQLYIAAAPAEWERIVQEEILHALTSGYLTPQQVIDESKHFIGVDSSFADLEHLNAQGAKIFTQNLRHKVEQMAGDTL